VPRTTIADAAAQILAKQRALAPEELGRLIAAQGLTRAKEPARAVTRALDVERRFHRLGDGRWALAQHILDGTTLTHRLTAREAAAESLALTPDFAPFLALAPDGLFLADGRPLSIVWDQHARDATGAETDAAFQGPPG